MKYLFFIIVLVVVTLTSGCISENKNPVTPAQTSPLNVPSSPPSPELQNAGEKNACREYRNPEKILKPEDLQIGDLIQVSIQDSRYDKDHGYIVENISSQNNHFLLKQIVKFKPENRWFGINTTNSVLITPGALMRDYPYKIGHTSEPLPEKCLSCGYTSGGNVNWCSPDGLMFLDCDDPRIMNDPRSSVINPPC